MLNLFNSLNLNRERLKNLLNLLKIKTLYKSRSLIDDFTVEVLSLEGPFEDVTNMTVTKKIEYETHNSNQIIFSKLSHMIEKLKVPELKIYSYGYNGNCIFILPYEYVKKLTINRINISINNFVLNNLTVLKLTSCIIVEFGNNFTSFIKILNSTSQNLKVLKISKLSFNKKIKNIIDTDAESENFRKIELLNLEILYLKSINIYYLNVENLVNLKNLILIDINLQFIDGLTNLTKLNNLNLSRNDLNNIEINNLNNLKILNLANNVLKTISLTNLTKLTILNLSCNKLIQLNIINSRNIEILNLLINQITSLDIKDLNKLKQLNVLFNPIKEIYLDHMNISKECTITINYCDNFDPKLISEMPGFITDNIIGL